MEDGTEDESLNSESSEKGSEDRESDAPGESSSEDAGDVRETPGEGEFRCDNCGAVVSVDDAECPECGEPQLHHISNIKRYAVIGVLLLPLTYFFGVATVRSLPPDDVLSFLLFFVVLGIALLGPLMLAVAGIAYRRRKELLNSA
ncbi:MAG: zinc ribbon domain-containing protein [Halobacteriales archaeon]